MSRGAWAPGCNVLGTVYFREHIRGHLTIESDLIKKLDYDNIIDAFSNGKGRSKYFEYNFKMFYILYMYNYNKCTYYTYLYE